MIRSRAWTKTKHLQTRTFALLFWLPPGEWRGNRGCILLGLRTPEGIPVSGVVESGYDRELVEQLPRLTAGNSDSSRRPATCGQEPVHS